MHGNLDFRAIYRAQQGFGHTRMRRAIFVVVVAITFRIDCDNEAVVALSMSDVESSSSVYEFIASASC